MEKLSAYETWYMSDNSVLSKAEFPPTKFLKDLREATRSDEVYWVGGNTFNNKYGCSPSNCFRETRYYTTFRDHRVCFAWDGVYSTDCKFQPPVEIRLDDCTLCGWGSENDGPSFGEIKSSIEKRLKKKEKDIYTQRLESLKNLG